MKFPQPHTLKQIATIIGTDYIGSDDFPVLGMNEIHVVKAGDIVFVDHPKYYDKALQCAATIILINKKVDSPEGKALLISDDPFRDFNKLADYFKPFQGIDQSISPSAKIGNNTHLQPNCFVGNNVVIGKDCIIHSNVSIGDDTVIGDNVTIHAGVVLGGDAFYYKRRPNGYDKLKSSGRVVLENNVEIGALCTIDRGVTSDTIIGEGSKLDNQVQIGHDTVIGKNCLIASQTGIAGCVIVEDDVTCWGQVGVGSALTIGKGAVILGQTGVTKTVEGGKVYSGTPIEIARDRLKRVAFTKKIPQMIKDINNLKNE